MTDTVIMRFNAFAFTSARNLNSVTFNQIGTISSAAISNVKLVRDNNSDGLVDAGDTVLGSGTLTAGAITFSGSPLQAVSTAAPVGLLLAASVPSVQPASTTLQFSVASAASVTWSPAGDLASYPMNSNPWVQRMAGNYTIAQTGSPDFTDLGAAFDALETIGMSGPVTLTFTDSATYTTGASYALGANGTTLAAILGLSATNTVTVRAAAGQRPVLTGGTTPDTYTAAASGNLAFRNVGNFTIEGIDFVGGNQFSLMLYCSVAGSSDNITIRNCRFSGVTTGAAIYMYGSSAAIAANNVLIENNIFWDIAGFASGTMGGGTNEGPVGVIGARRAGTNFVVRHNTILHTPTLAGSSVFYINGSTVPLADISYNVVYLSSTGASSFYNIQPTTGTALPSVSDRNVVYLGGLAVMCTNASYASWAQWQAAGKDVNGVNGDPLLANIASAMPDLHLSTASPAIDLAVGSTTTVDFDGTPRPFGPAADAGAFEYAPPGVIDVLYNSVVIPSSGPVNIGQVPQAGQPFQFTINNTGPGSLNLTGTPPVEITLDLNLDAGTIVQVQPALITLPANTGTTTFTLQVDPGALGLF
jgi:hypothetical protein